MQGKQDTHELPRRVAAQRCATPSRPPSGASATTTASLTAAGPARSRSSCCPCQRLPLFRWQRVLVRTGPFSLWKCSHTLGDLRKSGRGPWSWVSCRCEKCKKKKNCCLVTNVITARIFRQKEPKTEKVNVCLGLPFSRTYFYQ